MHYLVMLKSKNVIAQMEPEHLEKFKSGVSAAMKKGSIACAYSRVGGGLVLIVDSPSNAQLTVELRKHSITDAEVIPLVPLSALIDAHIDHRKTGKIQV